jgi:hypothetical protein
MARDHNFDSKMGIKTISKNEVNSKSHTWIIFSRIVLTIIAVLFAFSSFAQNALRKEPKTNERVIGTITGTVEVELSAYSDNLVKTAYPMLLEKAKYEYPNKVIDLIKLSITNCQDLIFWDKDSRGRNTTIREHYVTCPCEATIVEVLSAETIMNKAIIQLVDRGLSKIGAGSRLAIDQISVLRDGLDRETVKDQLIDVLLDKSYRVVAKEYLEKLKDEQEEQKSSRYNERTTVKTDNLSGVGYFLNIKVNEKSIRIQVVNVSTGEYEGNVTVDF